MGETAGLWDADEIRPHLSFLAEDETVTTLRQLIAYFRKLARDDLRTPRASYRVFVLYRIEVRIL